ncbi:hypothetical protein DUNSADRAFT_17538 [Dunaliella salina]|uniref:Encoded protein n=1 Tax=Dunaliella salina TaxID=3046 RepID=A0ABQ7H008_DUNSA|nr:hypothetical protein DUNSADRAFT_17538 [Dunaliella salina]|eukprot:KAF5840191.1 hypothetical protein DUNSADRAFT_17538 [Dunaliella salina]
MVACSANAGDSSPSRLRPRAAVVNKVRHSQGSHKQHSKQDAGAHAKGRAKEEDLAAQGNSVSSAQTQQIPNGKQHPKDNGLRGDTTKLSTEEGRAKPARSKSSAPEQSSRRQWQGHSREQGIGHKRTREGMASTSGSSSSSSSNSSSSSKRPRTGCQHI